MLLLSSVLTLDRCPHCGVDRPLLNQLSQWETRDFRNASRRCWRAYGCNRCGGTVTAAAAEWEQEVGEYFPSSPEVDDAIPERARGYLQQALDSLNAPSGAVMLCASAVDAMLKEKNYRDGSLYARIDLAATDHVITAEMAEWAHDVRLDANDERHADEASPLATPDEAKRAVEFTTALGQFMFVLPARIRKGIDEAQQGTDA